MTKKYLPLKKYVTNLFALSYGKRMIKLGAITVLASMLSTLTMFLLKAFISQKAGLFYVGIFQAGTTLSMVYLMTLLQAMSTDYYPRLSSNQNNHELLNEIVNDQLEIIINISGFLILVMLTFTPLILKIFYSEDFFQATPMVHWMIGSAFFRILAYPLNYVLLAKGKGMFYLFCEIVYNTVLVLSVVIFWDKFHIQSIGIGVMLGYLMYFVLNYFLSRKIISFFFKAYTLRIILIYLILISISFISLKLYLSNITLIFNYSIIIISIILSYKYFNTIFNLNKLFNKLINRK